MADLLNESGVPCCLCNEQGELYHLSDDDTQTRKWRHELFHGHCYQCQDGGNRRLSKLCDQCRHFRFEHLLFCDIENIHAEVVIDLVFRNFWANSALCDFCRFLCWYSRARPGQIEEDLGMNRKEPFRLRFFANENRSGFCINGASRDFDAMLLGKQMCNEKSGQSLLHIHPHINWHWLRLWLKEPLSKAYHWDLNIAQRNTLKGVRVVDVVQKCIILLSQNWEYLALSYVWGAPKDCEDDFQLLRCDISSLEIPGSLVEVKLPLTISDSCEVCRQLGYRYLWIDRLCIVQDDEKDRKAIQLAQMTSIYHGATLTIVATSGEDTRHGLSGVTPPRSIQQDIFGIAESFEIVESSESLTDCLTKSKWHTRGWTYQEQIASRALLHFTGSGLYLEIGSNINKEVYAEGPATYSRYSEDKPLGPLDVICAYSERNLTYPGDVLRAFTGILTTFYGERTSFGMPWNDFSASLLWTPTKFERNFFDSTGSEICPTWSWISSRGSLQFSPFEIHPRTTVYSLAYWCRPTRDFDDGTKTIRWAPIRETAEWPESDKTSSKYNTSISLAWLQGCIQSQPPSYALSNHFIEDYEDSSTIFCSSRSHWSDAFQGYKDMQLFENINTGSLDAMRCLAVHTQCAVFNLDMLEDWYHTDLPNGVDRGDCIIRNAECKPVGLLTLDEHATKRLKEKGPTRVNFISLSMGLYGIRLLFLRYIIKVLLYSRCSPVNKLFGCPCFNRRESDTGIVHIEECPGHADFLCARPWFSEFEHPWMNKVQAEQSTKHALKKHLEQVSYFDEHGSMLHEFYEPPMLNVMLIAPRLPSGDGQSTIYERFGIGQIWLKRWVEASPVFETIVLA